MQFKFSEVDKDKNILEWALCNENCPREDIPSVCMNPPKLPSFSSNPTSVDMKSILFTSSWFDIKPAPANGSVYLLSAVRTRRHQPGWKYDVSNTTDSMFVYTEDNHVDLADLYPIFSANHTVNYTCPEGYVFDHSNNILMSLTCINGTWRSHTFFNASKFCTRK